MLDPVARKWLQIVAKDSDEKSRLHTMSVEVIRAFIRDEIKDDKAVAEVVCLAPVLNKDMFHDLLSEFYSGIDHSGLLNFHQLEGLAQLIQGADPGHLSADDLVKILVLLSDRLGETHHQSTQNLYQLTMAISHVLDAMADARVTGLDRERVHEPLCMYLQELQDTKDPYLVYQAAYAYQALQCVPDDETTWQMAMRHTGKVIRGISGLVSATKGFDLMRFIEGLEDIQKGLSGMTMVVDVVKTSFKDGLEDGQTFLEYLKKGLSFERKRDWYSALRGADALIRDGELATFKKLVCEAPCRLDAAFQWGICQRLGEIVANPAWDTGTRQSAIAFLGEIYRDDATWGQQMNVKQWILNILMQMATSSGTGSQLQVHAPVAESLMKSLEGNGDERKQELYRLCRDNPTPYPVRIAALEFPSPSLLDRVQNRPDVEGQLRLLKKQRTKERGNAVYIPPQAKASIHVADNTQFPLMTKVKEFLESDQKVFLLLGESGAGKSTFNRELEYDLWQSYTKNGRIPLHINLPAIDKPEHDMIAKQLRRLEFTEPQIREMKHYRGFILICDGYDESQQTQNLYTSNQLNEAGEWDAQMIISCRSEYLGNDYRDRFQPGNRNCLIDSALYQEAVITSFSLNMVHEYIQQYVSVYQPLWQVKDYKQALGLIPNLQDLMKNPFLMTLSLEVLPRMVDPGQHLASTRVTRVALYDHFILQWLERGKKRLGEKELTPQARTAFESLRDEGFTQHGTSFLKKLAVAIYKEQGGNPIIKYSRVESESSWKDAFFSRDDEKQILREACPLKRNGNQYRFIHRSLLEYGMALAVCDPQDRSRMAGKQVLSRRGSIDSVLSLKSQVSDRGSTINDQEPDSSSPLVTMSFVNNHSLLQFLEERVQQEPDFKEQLFAYIEHSKKDKKWRKAAANAITILVRAGIQFINTDFRGIQIPRADLSYGVFDTVQLQGADLRKVNLRGVWLRQTDLSASQMANVQFGELPLLTENDKVYSCAYSPDGMLFAAGLVSGDINVYMTSTWERTCTLKGHTKCVMGIAFSPTGNQIASCSADKTILLWDVEQGTCVHTLTCHTDAVCGVAYSPQGDMLASASADETVRLWDLVTGDCRHTLSSHTKRATCVAYSPKGGQIASGSGDCTVRLWDVITGDCILTLSGHENEVWSVAFSPHGQQVASAGMDKTVRLWDVRTGTCLHSLSGHYNTVFCVTFSPRSDQLASASQDGTVRLWDVESGFCLRTLTGHDNTVYSVAYSPRGDQVASASSDNTVRLWDVSSRASHVISKGHSMRVTCVECSSNGDLIVSSSMDVTIRLWDVQTGACLKILRGHTNTVSGVAFSPQGNHIATSSGDMTVRIWDIGTGDCRLVLRGHTDFVNTIAYSPDGDQLASVSKDKTIRLWNVATGDCYRTLVGHSDGVFSVMYSPDGKQFATGSADRTVRLWNVDDGECYQVLEGHEDVVGDVVYSPHGDQLASSSADKTIRLWDVQGRECRLVLIGHEDCVFCIAYSRQGNLLASGSRDKTVRLWDTASGECRAVIPNFQDGIRAVGWSATLKALDGNFLITGCLDGSLAKWQVKEDEDKCNVQLQWSATNGTLTTIGASIQDVSGLTPLDVQLLMQRGAVGEPEGEFREIIKVESITSVVSKLKVLSDGVVLDAAVNTLPSEQPAQVVNETNDP
ncbi:MAG: WD40-repeat-containing domain protein [Benniella sp.]|nr:MAG: WD40-repeat-containing domain protein [Benniella sp.]